MTKKPQRSGAPPAPLGPRIQRAIAEGRFQQALELAKQQHKFEPTPAHLELLKKCYLGRARQLREQGAGRDAVTTLEAALRLDGATPAWVEQVAGEMALAGGVPQALALAAQLPPGSPAVPKIRAYAADAALQQEAAGRSLLPADLHADFDRVLLAFRQVEQGEDEPARATLQDIGLRSPFLEWKLLLRGLQAYYANDDARALENWQRLSPERLPARLAAPFRAQLDAAYRAAQPPAAQRTLQNMLDRGQGSVLAQELRRLRAALAENPDSLAAPFRQAEALLPLLRREAPQLVPRLARCFYWAMLNTGPDDVPRYQRVFGAPPDDPHFHRLQAIGYEKGFSYTYAHRHWQDYEKDVAANPAGWPAGQAERVRALLWLHLGRNAQQLPSKKKMAKLPGYLRNAPDRPEPLSPPADQCFERAVALTPDQLEPYSELFEHYRKEEEPAKAAKAAQRLLERFPDHVPTLTAYGELCTREKRYGEALRLFQRALRGNPLDRKLREQVGTAHLLHARAQVEAGHFDAARQDYEAAAKYPECGEEWMLCARRAACEFKAGDGARAEELLQRAYAGAPHPVLVAFRLLEDAIRYKLPRPSKARFDKEFKEHLAAPPVPAAAVGLLSSVVNAKLLGVTYTGSKTHEAAVLRYLKKTPLREFNEEQLELLARAFLALQKRPDVQRYTAEGRRRFPANPYFPFFQGVSHFMNRGTGIPPVWQVRPLFDEAERLARALPPDEKREQLLNDIQERQKTLNALDPFGGGLEDFLDNFFDDEDDEDDGYD